MGMDDLLILAEKIKQAKRKARECRAAAREANVGYQKLARRQPELDEMAKLADDLAVEFKRLYAAATEAYQARNGRLAGQLSARGRMVERECKNLNRQISDLRDELRMASARAKVWYDEAREHEWKIVDYRYEARALRDTPLVGFSPKAAMFGDEVGDFLDEFPLPVFDKLASIRYADEMKVEGGHRILGKTAMKNFDTKTKLVTVPILESAEITIFRNDSKRSLKKAITREVGHVVYRGFMDEPKRRQWMDLYQNKRKERGLITHAARLSAEEDFYDSFAYFKLKPERLKKFDEKGYTFISNIYDALLKQT